MLIYMYMYNHRFLVLTKEYRYSVSQRLTECQRHSQHKNTTIFTISFFKLLGKLLDLRYYSVFHFWPKLTHPAARSLCDS